MNRLVVALYVVCAVGGFHRQALAEPVYTAGHSDIGVEYLTGPPRFKMIIHFDGNAVFEDGSIIHHQNVDPASVSIRVPDPSVLRSYLVNDPEDPSDDADLTLPTWDFLGAEINEPFWFLPQTNDPNKPFFGFATYDLTASQWNGPIRWSLEEIVSAPAGGEFSQWQTSFAGDPNVLFASYDGVDPLVDSFTQPIGGHDHYNWGFSKAGVYEVRIGATATRIGGAEAHGSAVFTFLVGDDAGSELNADYNANGVVDAADYVLWRKTFGQSGTGLVADGDRDGTVGQSDYDLWRHQFGSMPAGQTGIGARNVPEPASLFLLLTAAVLAVGPRRR